jgi:hypothetical protein
MFHRWAALVLVLALCAMSPKNAAGQTQSSQPRSTSGGLGNNYPNPFNPDTFIPFSVGADPSSCADDRVQHVVSIQIRNVLGQLTAIPILQGPTASASSTGNTTMNGQPVSNLSVGCGSYVTWWNGKILTTTKEAASGMYIVMLTIDGKLAATKRIYYRK